MRIDCSGQVNIYPEKQLHGLSESSGCVVEGLVDGSSSVEIKVSVLLFPSFPFISDSSTPIAVAASQTLWPIAWKGGFHTLQLCVAG